LEIVKTTSIHKTSISGGTVYTGVRT